MSLLFAGATGERFGAIERKAYAKGFGRGPIGKIRAPPPICPEKPAIERDSACEILRLES
jgi:hypothetical protein